MRANEHARRVVARRPRPWTGHDLRRLREIFAAAHAAGVMPPQMGELARIFEREHMDVLKRAMMLRLVGREVHLGPPVPRPPKPWPGDPSDPASRFDGERDHKMAALLSLHQEPRPMYAPPAHPSRTSLSELIDEERVADDL